MKRIKPLLISINLPVVMMFLFLNLLHAASGPYTEIVCSILWTTEYTVTNIHPTFTGTTVSVFYDETGSTYGNVQIQLPPQGSAPVIVADYVPAGYQGYAVISADIPVSATVDVGPGAPLQATFDAAPTSGPAPHIVTFTNTSSGYDTSLWSFGDGMTSALDSPTYTYTLPGTYTVNLTASQTGCLETTPQFNPTASAFIYVQSGDSAVYLPAVLGK
jgi:PKD repeat protein